MLVQLSNNFLTFGCQFGFIDLIASFKGEEHLLRQTAKKIIETYFPLTLTQALRFIPVIKVLTRDRVDDGIAGDIYMNTM